MSEGLPMFLIRREVHKDIERLIDEVILTQDLSLVTSFLESNYSNKVTLVNKTIEYFLDFTGEVLAKCEGNLYLFTYDTRGLATLCVGLRVQENMV